MLGFDYYAHESEADLAVRDPGNFVFGELLALSVFPGVNNDAFADGLDSATRTTLRDWRIEYRRPAFRGALASSEWFIGWRRVDHKRFEEAVYLALAPDLPPLLTPPLPEFPGGPVGPAEPRPDLAPIPDFAATDSHFEGRGPTVGLDLDFPLWKDKLLFEGGASFAILRGDIDTRYRALTSVYALDAGGTVFVLDPPYDEIFQGVIDAQGNFGCDPSMVPCFALLDAVFQTVARTGIDAQNLDTTAQVLEGKLGFRWRALKWFEVFGGFKATRYDDVGLTVRPQNIQTIELDTLPNEQIPTFLVNVGDVQEIDRSATYEGFFAGVSIFLF
jgi:hypothetical protein